ncbi:MAG: SIMPL domain-containing protein [Pseudomonadota bacterium]|nr:SIMPL domain-containing protein [Pseudomonadota bacterium]
MRWLVSGLGLVFAVVPAAGGVPMPASATASPVSTQPLAANEVLLELNGFGLTHSDADRALLALQVTGEGPTDAQARAAHEGRMRRLVAAARSAGIAAADIEAAPAESGRPVAPDLEMLRRLERAADEASEGGRDPVSNAAEVGVSSELRIDVRDLRRLEPLQRVLEQAGAGQMPPPVYSLSDDRSARRAARNQAMATVRADAEAYAASLGMRVVRIVRVTERVGMDFMSLMLSETAQLQNMFERRDRRSRRVATYAMVGVDFALAPQ